MKSVAKIISEIVSRVSVFGPMARSSYRRLINPPRPFIGSENYWIERYDSGQDSGDGSYNKLAEYKAEVLNSFVKEKALRTIIEFGCGDGNQLKLAYYPSYIGFDVSPRAIALCEEAFSGDRTKEFHLMKEYRNESAQLALSLDVIYHLVEDDIFEEHIRRLFASSESYVIIYSSDRSENRKDQAVHVKHRQFTTWVNKNEPGWRLICHIPNLYPYTGDTRTGSSSDFYIYAKA